VGPRLSGIEPRFAVGVQCSALPSIGRMRKRASASHAPTPPAALRRTFQDLSDQSALVAHASTKLLVETAAVLALSCRDGALWRRLVHANIY